MKKIEIPIEVSARHLHITQADLEKCFGAGHQLKPKKEITQPGQFAAEETLKVVGPKSEFPSVRIVGPVRVQTQLELSVTDCYTLGVEPALLLSGDLADSTGGIRLVGPAGEVMMDRGVIVPMRHLHLSVDEADQLGLSHLDTVSVSINGPRSVVFRNIKVRSRKDVDSLALHLDTDEANAAGIKPGMKGELLLEK